MPDLARRRSGIKAGGGTQKKKADKPPASLRQINLHD
jgi:hypothetical protein